MTDAQRPVRNLSYHMNAIIVKYLEKGNTIEAARDLNYLKVADIKLELIVQASVTAVEGMYHGTMNMCEKLAELVNSLLNSGHVCSHLVFIYSISDDAGLRRRRH